MKHKINLNKIGTGTSISIKVHTATCKESIIQKNFKLPFLYGYKKPKYNNSKTNP